VNSLSAEAIITADYLNFPLAWMFLIWGSGSPNPLNSKFFAVLILAFTIFLWNTQISLIKNGINYQANEQGMFLIWVCGHLARINLLPSRRRGVPYFGGIFLQQLQRSDTFVTPNNP
jgi:hypothetical protein